MEKLLARLSQFNRREQMTIFVCALVVAVWILWLAILSPLKHKRDSLLQTTVATQQSLGKVQLLARQYELLSQQSQVQNGGDLSALLDASLRDNGITMTSFTPGAGGEARVRVDRIASDTLFQWLYDLETKYQVAIHELSITASNDPGLVAVNLRLEKP